jgi:diaminohydroxyphosphoribosylaminopyrimidine deaminase / 5-amino-6-(5-phosphoribosylamino)uracil reductase
MRRALELATLGIGHVSPNPMVGCAIVHDKRIIGEGWHKKYGGPHAEVNAVHDVREKHLLKESTAYVTLEPCAHFGKTPPCADMLVHEGVKRVVICNVDTNPLVGGKGIEKLRAAGIEITTGVMEEKGRQLNRRFFTFIEKQRPYIVLKWAETADGLIARENFDSKWISNEYSRMLVHRWRGEEDAVLVGYNTTLHDNPKLNVRDWTGRNPVRIVLDRDGKLPPGLNVFDGTQPTICYTSTKSIDQENLVFVHVNRETFIQDVLSDLFLRKIQSVIVEGGSQILHEFISKELWDEARVFRSKTFFGKGVAAPKLEEQPTFVDDIHGDKLNVYFNK